MLAQQIPSTTTYICWANKSHYLFPSHLFLSTPDVFFLVPSVRRRQGPNRPSPTSPIPPWRPSPMVPDPRLPSPTAPTPRFGFPLARSLLMAHKRTGMRPHWRAALPVGRSFTGAGSLLPALAASPRVASPARGHPHRATSLACGYGEKTNEEDDTWDPLVILCWDGFG